MHIEADLDKENFIQANLFVGIGKMYSYDFYQRAITINFLLFASAENSKL